MRNVVLDRDGTLIHDRGPGVRPCDIELLPGAVAGLRAFAGRGSRFFVVTNQAAIGRGITTTATFLECTTRLDALLAEGGIRIAGCYVCPDPDDFSDCRKPNTGLWSQLCAEHPDVRADETLVIGDKDSDIVFGRNIGAQTARVLAEAYASTVPADYEAWRLDDLAELIFGRR